MRENCFIKRNTWWLLLAILLLSLTGCTTSARLYEKASKLIAQGDYAQAALIYSDLGGYEESTKMAMYAKAAAAGEDGNYTECLLTLEELGDFQDSSLLLQYYTARQYETQAAAAVASGDAASTCSLYTEALKIYHTLSLVLDANTRSTACIQAMYDTPAAIAANGDYAGAATIMAAFVDYMEQEQGGVGIYADAPIRRDYYTACQYEATGETVLAAKSFFRLGTFHDAAQHGEEMYQNIYTSAEAALADGDPYDAYKKFCSIAEYQNSLERSKECLYLYGKTLLYACDYAGARQAFSSLGEYIDASTCVKACWYAEGEALLNSDTPDYEGAKLAFGNAKDYEDAVSRFATRCYEIGESYFTADMPDYQAAIDAFTQAGSHEDAAQRIQACWYKIGEAKLSEPEPDYGGAKLAFENAGDYKDAVTRYANYWYNMGENLLSADPPNYEAAQAAFIEAGDYLDATEYAAYGCSYRKAMDLMATGDFSSAYSVLVTITAYRDVDYLLSTDPDLLMAARNARIAPFTSIGQYVTYGTYEQDNNLENGKEPIEWLVLDYNVETQEALLISRYGLDTQPFKNHWGSPWPEWDDSDIRKWLNRDFLHTAFSADEQTAIIQSMLTTPDSYWQEGGDDTRDHVFLLSTEEAEAYFENEDSRRTTATEYALAQGAIQVGSTLNGVDCCMWTLRSPEIQKAYTMGVHGNGSFCSCDKEARLYAIRPVFRLDLKAL